MFSGAVFCCFSTKTVGKFAEIRYNVSIERMQAERRMNPVRIHA